MVKMDSTLLTLTLNHQANKNTNLIEYHTRAHPVLILGLNNSGSETGRGAPWSGWRR